MQLPNVVAIVSGAARGIGAAEGRALVQAGACVVLGDILDDQGEHLARELNAGQSHVCARYVHLDVTRLADWTDAVATAHDAFGRLTTLVNNAGIS